MLTIAWLAAAALFAMGEALWAILLLIGATLHLRNRLKAMRRVRPVRRRWSAADATRRQSHQRQADYSIVRIGRDPATGRIDGVVRSGPYAGFALREMPLDALLAVAATIDAADSAALELVALLLDELYPGWSAEGGSASHREAACDLSAARRLLGVDAAASHEEICAAHRRLIRRVHPDVGGSAALTAEINAAKDLLLSVA